jgi:hypothetical protein
VARAGGGAGSALLIVLLAPGASSAPGEKSAGRAPASCPDPADQVLARFEARPDEPVQSFRARRRMRAEGLGRQGFMEVLVELDPERGFRWTVEAERGSTLLRKKGFGSMLRKEEEIREMEGADGNALSADNYDLAVVDEEPGGLVRIRATPRRKAAGLVDGTFIVTCDTADLVRVEGRLARTPSFWITRVEVVRQFRRIQGHRVVVRVESVAHVRLFGAVRLTVDFDYEMIDGEELGPAPESSLTAARARPAAPAGTY